MNINPVAAAYLLLLGGVGYTLWRAMPHSPGEWHYPVGPFRRLFDQRLPMGNTSPDTYWPKDQPEHAGATEDSPALTEEIARIEADPDVPALLSAREEREREDAAYAALLHDPGEAIDKALESFRSALEPVRLTLQAWHEDGRRHCAACAC